MLARVVQIAVINQIFDVILLQSAYAVGYGAVVDSGTTFTYLPTAVFGKFSKAVDDFAKSKGLQPSPGSDPQYNDICWKGASDDIKNLDGVFPEVRSKYVSSLALSYTILDHLVHMTIMQVSKKQSTKLANQLNNHLLSMIPWFDGKQCGNTSRASLPPPPSSFFRWISPLSPRSRSG